MASDPGKFSCEICSENLRSKTGACVATVSLFSETSNKEFSNACNGKPVVFAELLRVLGIVLVQDRQRSVCKKCARKIVNCYKLFTELQQAFIDSSGWKSSEGNTETTCTLQTPQNSRKENCVPQHQRSPTGITPTAKRLRIYFRSVTSESIVYYLITATSRFWMCHTVGWMVLCQALLSLLPLPPPPSHISSISSPLP